MFNIKFLLRDFKGVIEDEKNETRYLYKYKPKKNLIVKVRKTDFDAAIQKVKKLKTENKRYRVLFGNDCVSFLAEIAKKIELKTPSRWTNQTPEWFVEELMRIN